MQSIATYYIDPQNGQAENNGLSPTAAKKSYTDIDVQSGDRILFKRGSFIRDRLYTKNMSPTAHTVKVIHRHFGGKSYTDLKQYINETGKDRNSAYSE